MSYLLQIIGLTLFVSAVSTIISTILGLPLGYLLSRNNSKSIRFFQSITTAMTGFPPVVAGLCIYFLITRNGPLGSLKLLYSPNAMIIAQILIVLPIITAFAYPSFIRVRQELTETCIGLRLPPKKTFILMLKECRFALVSAVMSGFGRAISEVGAVMMVGGNIAGKTRVMTTAIMTETSKGDYEKALILGAILLLVSIAINLFASRFREG